MREHSVGRLEHEDEKDAGVEEQDVQAVAHGGQVGGAGGVWHSAPASQAGLCLAGDDTGGCCVLAAAAEAPCGGGEAQAVLIGCAGLVTRL